jgi:MoxR-like ATPase
LSDAVGTVILGRPQAIRLVAVALLARGHVLLEDAPGTGKTQLARSISAVVSGVHNRIQFTPDLLPSDLLGVNAYDPRDASFQFRPGPVFCNILLADEINRASPKTQSALLQVMEEGRVTIDGETRPVPAPFLVIATQNQHEKQLGGVYELPAAQMDRFLIKTSIGYPGHEAAMAILEQSGEMDRSARLAPLMTTDQISELAEAAATVAVDKSVIDYALRLCELTREDPKLAVGVSVRGTLALVRAAKVWALSAGRPFVIPDDIKQLVKPVLAHRVILEQDEAFGDTTAEQVLADILERTAPPADRGA